MISIGVDPGFGNFKVATATASASERVNVTVVPSVVGVGETDLGLLSIGSLGRRRRQAVPDRVTFGGVTYLVGENVARYARPVQRMDFLRLSDGPELRALFYDAVFHLLGGGEHEEVSMMVGLPVEIMADRKRAKETLRGLRTWIIGRHRFTVNNEEPAALAVADVRAMAQPAGTFFAWGLDDGGRWTRAKADLKAPVAICDIGFNTLDLFTVEGGNVVGRFTGGDTAGMRRAAELLINAVKAYGVEISLHEADALLRARRPRLYTAGGEVDLRPQVKQALDTAAAGVVTFVEQRWGNGRQFAHLLFTGGGAEALKEALLRQYPHGVVLPNSVAANAIGLARYAARVFK